MLLRDYIRICCIRKSTALAEVARKAGMSAQNCCLGWDINVLTRIICSCNKRFEFLVTGLEKNIYKQKYDELRQRADAVIVTLKD